MKLKIREWGNQKWKEELEERPTLKWYKQGKPCIQYDQCYTNSLNSKIFARARTNTLQVEEFIHRRDRDHSKICKLCRREEEDLIHFMLMCPKLRSKRNNNIMQKWYNEDKDQQLVDILFSEKDHDKIRKMVGAMWLLRKDLLRPP